MKILSKKIYFFLLPIAPLLDLLWIKSFPYITTILYILICFIHIKKRIKFRGGILILFLTYILSIIIAIINIGLKIEYLMVILTLLTFSVLAINIGKDVKTYLPYLVKFVYIYFSLNTLIYIWRLLQYGFDFNRLRSGISIYGGNSAHLIFIILLFLLKKYDTKMKYYYKVLSICFINSLLYVSKGAILIMIIWVALDIIHNKKTKILCKKNIIIALVLLLICMNFLTPDFINFFKERFEIWFNLYEKTGSFMGTRGQIIDFTISYLKSNPLSLIFGIGNTNFKEINLWGYSNTHNLFLDLIMDCGMLGLIIFIEMIFKTIKNSKYKIYFLLCIIYATIEGVSLLTINLSDCIMTAYGFFFICLCYQDKLYEINNKKLSEG